LRNDVHVLVDACAGHIDPLFVPHLQIKKKNNEKAPKIESTIFLFFNLFIYQCKRSAPTCPFSSAKMASSGTQSKFGSHSVSRSRSSPSLPRQHKHRGHKHARMHAQPPRHAFLPRELRGQRLHLLQQQKQQPLYQMMKKKKNVTSCFYFVFLLHQRITCSTSSRGLHETCWPVWLLTSLNDSAGTILPRT
jgi:hypothetical protein